jgi:hypothetical protein
VGDRQGSPLGAASFLFYGASLKNPACLPITNNVTVAILAQGTSSGWCVSQAFFSFCGWFDPTGRPFFVQRLAEGGFSVSAPEITISSPSGEVVGFASLCEWMKKEITVEFSNNCWIQLVFLDESVCG